MDLKESIRELQNNETFKHILATLLAIGNFLNGKKVRASTIITSTYSYDTFSYQCGAWQVKSVGRLLRDLFICKISK